MHTRIAATICASLLLLGCERTGSEKVSMAAQPAALVCAGYVAGTGTPTFNNCLAYQETRDPGASVPPYRLDQYNNRVDAAGYKVDTTGRRMPVQSPYVFGNRLN